VSGGQRVKDRTGHYPIEGWGVGAPAAPGRAGGTDPGTVRRVGKYAPVEGDDSTETARTAVRQLLAAYPGAVHVWWGGNYYSEVLPASSCWLVWDKDTTGHFADCELAWTNQARATRLFRHRWNGMLRDSERERRWHPTQKPAALMAWVYEVVGGAGARVLDPFLGSGPTLIAAEQRGQTVYGCEKSADYVSIALERWATLTDEVPTRLA
jgi:DNA methylase